MVVLYWSWERRVCRIRSGVCPLLRTWGGSRSVGSGLALKLALWLAVSQRRSPAALPR